MIIKSVSYYFSILYCKNNIFICKFCIITIIFFCSGDDAIYVIFKTRFFFLFCSSLRITSYNVCYTKLLRTNAGASKIGVIKVIRDITGLGLKEAKDLADNGGNIKENAAKDEAEEIKTKLEEAGATVELK